ncbi:unnamed protein product, partial [Vitis vinifera]|uniref:Uncharacterized protein n=1 Tax=Vitis vinifera TaxID=29760 RepID=D7TJC4_VITVI
MDDICMLFSSSCSHPSTNGDIWGLHLLPPSWLCLSS